MSVPFLIKVAMSEVPEVCEVYDVYEVSEGYDGLRFLVGVVFDGGF